VAGEDSDKIRARAASVGQDWKPTAFPVEFYALGGQGTGIPLRVTMTAFGPTYACTLTGDVDIGLQADQQEATKAPLPVIEVKDLESTLAAVTATGASITKPIFSFPGGRRFHFLDPGGNELAAMQVDA